MEYHEPAAWWQLYDLQDFESYCREFVINGRFHPSVPKEIREEYLLAEYMMAHAYYHPLLYDEAYSKVLRIVEHAVRLRCNQLDIRTVAGINKRTGKTNKQKLESLIDELELKEPTKRLREFLHKLRDERNEYMHSDKEGNSGGLLRARVRRCCVLLNVLFMDEQYFLKTHEHKLQMMDKIEPFRTCAATLSLLGHHGLIEGVLLTAADHTSNGWVYCLHIATVPAEIDNILATGHQELKSFPVKDLAIDNTGITARLADIDEPLSITPTNYSSAMEHLRKYNTIRDKASEQYIRDAEFNLFMHLDIDIVKWGYEWGWKAVY